MRFPHTVTPRRGKDYAASCFRGGPRPSHRCTLLQTSASLSGSTHGQDRISVILLPSTSSHIPCHSDPQASIFSTSHFRRNHHATSLQNRTNSDHLKTFFSRGDKQHSSWHSEAALSQDKACRAFCKSEPTTSSYTALRTPIARMKKGFKMPTRKSFSLSYLNAHASVSSHEA